MLAFLDFEASSLARRSYPIEVGWVFEDGQGESYLIRPPSAWDDWDSAAQAIHGIDRDLLLREGVPHDAVARHMVKIRPGTTLLRVRPPWTANG